MSRTTTTSKEAPSVSAPQVPRSPGRTTLSRPPHHHPEQVQVLPTDQPPEGAASPDAFRLANFGFSVDCVGN